MRNTPNRLNCIHGGLTMTPSQQAKEAGLKSLSRVSDITGVSLQTLDNWSKNKPDLFTVVLAGCWLVINKKQKAEFL